MLVFTPQFRELKQRRFWAAYVNRKFMFLLLARFHARPVSYKALILAFINLTFWIKRVKYTSNRRSLHFRLTFVAKKRLCLSSLMLAVTAIKVTFGYLRAQQISTIIFQCGAQCGVLYHTEFDFLWLFIHLRPRKNGFKYLALLINIFIL